jgi:hypothetical protein
VIYPKCDLTRSQYSCRAVQIHRVPIRAESDRHVLHRDDNFRQRRKQIDLRVSFPAQSPPVLGAGFLLEMLARILQTDIRFIMLTVLADVPVRSLMLPLLLLLRPLPRRTGERRSVSSTFEWPSHFCFAAFVVMIAAVIGCAFTIFALGFHGTTSCPFACGFSMPTHIPVCGSFFGGGDGNFSFLSKR